MDTQLWSWILGSLGAVVLLLVGESEKTRRTGWMIGLATQALWYSYAFVSEQYGFLVSASVFTAVNARGLYRHHRARRAAEQAAAAVPTEVRCSACPVGSAPARG